MGSENIVLVRLLKIGAKDLTVMLANLLVMTLSSKSKCEPGQGEHCGCSEVQWSYFLNTKGFTQTRGLANVYTDIVYTLYTVYTEHCVHALHCVH